jgi:hypothetical protein
MDRQKFKEKTLKIELLLAVFPIGPPKVVGPSEIGNFLTPTGPTHSCAPEALFMQERDPASPTATDRCSLPANRRHHLGPDDHAATSFGRLCTTPPAAPPTGRASSSHRRRK